jgi:hypothetical protein
MDNYTSWLWEVDGIPDTADDAIYELERLRTALAMALL